LAVPNHVKSHDMNVVLSYQVAWCASNPVCDNGDLTHRYFLSWRDLCYRIPYLIRFCLNPTHSGVKQPSNADRWICRFVQHHQPLSLFQTSAERHPSVALANQLGNRESIPPHGLAFPTSSDSSIQQSSSGGIGHLGDSVIGQVANLLLGHVANGPLPVVPPMVAVSHDSKRKWRGTAPLLRYVATVRQ